MRKALSVFLLIILLACSALADPNPGVLIADAPAPIAGDVHTGELQPGDVPSTDGDIQNGAAATFMQVVWNLLALS
jgi:hypothetical protein